ncbi:DUF6126 family protein [Streptacidiphilus fuscans]|uniref:Uncharacterized protein n=1 Tax=Streptacidiphilus fuscans TaxID=2789292 RepID=A0A931FG75_9ACTN|nr:DUF6126 family protein [Streptacidiphilus fuscans]MBF9073622.1 hypothetical protein [Streptacidiphilus fuscans]
MADHSPHAAPVPATPVPLSVEDGSTHTERRVNVRVFIYVIGLHVFAGLAMLLFFAGQHRS